MELDHLFVFVDGPSEAEEALTLLGLDETYRRVHPGQGTANVCCAFDDAYLELLWLTSPDEARSPRTARTRLFERAGWRETGCCPFGIAWRGSTDPLLDVWAYAPLYLPEGMTIEVAVDSDDPMQPMLFASPGKDPPAAWPPERRGRLQRGRGRSTLGAVTLRLPETCAPAPALLLAADRLGIALEHGTAWELVVQPPYGEGVRELRLPISGERSGGLARR